MGSKGSGTGILLKSVDPCLNPRVGPETSPGHDEEARIHVPGRRSLVWPNRLMGPAIAAVSRGMAFGRAGGRLLERQ